jgi:hypothetical protein
LTGSSATSADRACARYEANLRKGRGTLARHGSIERQMDNFRAAYVHGRELEAQVREVLVDYFYADNRFGSSPARWRTYFRAFARAARAGR